MRVARWGDSLAVRLPKRLVDELGLKAGDELEIVDAHRERLAVERRDTRAAAVARMGERGWTRPADFRFDRDEANER